MLWSNTMQNNDKIRILSANKSLCICMCVSARAYARRGLEAYIQNS